jgi:flagellar hook-length control protein FliK
MNATDSGVDENDREVSQKSGIQPKRSNPAARPIIVPSQNDTVVDTLSNSPQSMQSRVDLTKTIAESSQTIPHLPVNLPVEQDSHGKMTHAQAVAENAPRSTTTLDLPESSYLRTGIDPEKFSIVAEAADNQVLADVPSTHNPTTDFKDLDFDVVSPRNPAIEHEFSESQTEVQTPNLKVDQNAIRSSMGTVQEFAVASFANEPSPDLHRGNAERTNVGRTFMRVNPEIVVPEMSAQEPSAGGINDVHARSVSQSTTPVLTDEGVLKVLQMGNHLQPVFPVHSDESSRIEARSANVSVPSQSAFSRDAHLNSVKDTTFQASRSVEIPTIGSETTEQHSDSQAIVTSKSTIPLSEESELSRTINVNSRLSDQTLDSTGPNLENRETILPGESKTSAEKLSLPVSTAETKKAAASMKNDSEKSGLSIEPDLSVDRESPALANEFEPKGVLESTPPSANIQKETNLVGPIEKGPTVPINPHAVEVVQHVIRQLNGKLKSGFTSMRLQLNPDALGAIDVEVRKDVQGVRVTFFAEQSSTGKLLETQLAQLRQSLVDSGVQLSSVNIGQNSYSGQEGGSQHQNTNFAQTSHREDYQNELHVQESSHTELGTGQTTEVDYFI